MEFEQIFLSFSIFVLGVIFTYIVGRILRKENRVEGETITKKQVVESLLSELELNNKIIQRGLGKAKTIRGSEVDWFTSSLFSSSYDSLINSGKFTLLSPDVQVSVSMYYETLNRLKEFGEKAAPPHFKDMYQDNIQTINSLIELLSETYNDILDLLRKELE